MHLPAYSGTLSLLLYLLFIAVSILGMKRRGKRDFLLWIIVGLGVAITMVVFNLHWAHVI